MPVAPTLINKRLHKLKALLAQHKLDALCITAEPNVSYISGYAGTESLLLITRDKQYFLTDFRYLEQAQRETKGYQILLKSKLSYPQMIQEIARKNGLKRVGFESQRLSYIFYQQLTTSPNGTEWIAAPALIDTMRMAKDKEEITLIKRAAQISVEGVRLLESKLSSGQKEREIQARLEFDTKMLGAQKPAFDIIIAAGPNSSMPHAITGNTVVQKQDMVLVDMGVVYEGYHSDLTRCFFVGKIPRLHQKVYDIVRKAQELGLKKAKKGVKASDVDKACRDYIDKQGYGKYFGHSTGHGVGLEIHELPNVSMRSQTVLEPGMVVTVEPGIYLPGKFGVRIEDMVLITENGREVLTQALRK